MHTMRDVYHFHERQKENFQLQKGKDFFAKDRIKVIFGQSNLDETAKELGLPILARLPIDPTLAKACDSGRVEEVAQNYLEEVAGQLDK